MFTRRQAIRWAELWLSCWNEGDFDTLLALYRDTRRFGKRVNGELDVSNDNRIEALKRHWAAVPFGIHSVRGDLERVSWDPETRELTIVYATDIGGTACMDATWSRSTLTGASCSVRRAWDAWRMKSLRSQTTWSFTR
jgi:hypothetical protein